MSNSKIRHLNPKPEDGAHRLEDYVPAEVAEVLKNARDNHGVSIIMYRYLESGKTDIELFVGDCEGLSIKIPSLVRDVTNLIIEDSGRVLLHPSEIKKDADILYKIIESWVTLQKALMEAQGRKTTRRQVCKLILLPEDGWGSAKYDLK